MFYELAKCQNNMTSKMLGHTNIHTTRFMLP